MNVEVTPDGIGLFTLGEEPVPGTLRTRLAEALGPQRATLPPLLLLDARGLSTGAEFAEFEDAIQIVAGLLAGGFASRIAIVVRTDHIGAGVRAIGAVGNASIAAFLDFDAAMAWLGMPNRGGAAPATPALEADVRIALTWLQKIAAVAPGVIFSFRLRPDGTSCLPYSSPSIERLFGLRPEELTRDASPIWPRVHPDDLQRLHASIAEAAEAFSAWHCEFRGLSMSGNYVWIQGHSVPEREADGSILWYGFLSDVTEKKDAELKLAEDAVRRHILFEQSKDGIVVLDAEGRVFELNQSFADMLGYPIDEARRLAVWDWDGVWTREQLLDMLANRPPDTFETRHRRKDGSLVDVEVSASLADWHGQPLRFCICRDITERKKAVAQVKVLQGLLPLCAWCKKVRDDSGYWSQIEVYVAEHSQADFSHGICPDCETRFAADRSR